MENRKLAWFAAVALSGTLLVGCGDDSEEQQAGGGESTTSSETAGSETTSSETTGSVATSGEASNSGGNISSRFIGRFGQWFDLRFRGNRRLFR